MFRDYKGYKVSPKGEVKKQGEIIKAEKNSDGELIIDNHLVKTMVCECYKFNNKNHKKIIHEDGDKTNNNILNLKYVSKNKTKKTDKKNYNYNKLSEEEIKFIIKNPLNLTMFEMEDFLTIPRQHIYKIKEYDYYDKQKKVYENNKIIKKRNNYIKSKIPYFINNPFNLTDRGLAFQLDIKKSCILNCMYAYLDTNRIKNRNKIKVKSYINFHKVNIDGKYEYGITKDHIEKRTGEDLNEDDLIVVSKEEYIEDFLRELPYEKWMENNIQTILKFLDGRIF